MSNALPMSALHLTINGQPREVEVEITFRNGAAEQQNYADFEVARMRDAPVIETHIVPSDLGRPIVPPIAPAIAIFAATGKRIRKLPIRLEDLTA